MMAVNQRHQELPAPSGRQFAIPIIKTAEQNANSANFSLLSIIIGVLPIYHMSTSFHNRSTTFHGTSFDTAYKYMCNLI